MTTHVSQGSRYMNAVVSLLLWLWAIFYTIVCVTLGLIIVYPVSLIIPTRKPMHDIARAWAQGIIFMAPFWKIEIKGKQHIKPGEAYMIVSNHQSILDIILTLATLPVHFKFMAKKELFAIPFLGWHMLLTGYIPIDRGNSDSARQALVKAGDWLKRGVSILMFPEGTRSRDGEIHSFKPGAFKLAKNGEVKILPIVLDNTGDAIPRNSWSIQKSTCFKVHILAPVLIRSSEITKGMTQVHDQMAQALDKMRGKHVKHS